MNTKMLIIDYINFKTMNVLQSSKLYEQLNIFI